VAFRTLLSFKSSIGLWKVAIFAIIRIASESILVLRDLPSVACDRDWELVEQCLFAKTERYALTE
jgi:hypothetical protein